MAGLAGRHGVWEPLDLLTPSPWLPQMQLHGALASPKGSRLSTFDLTGLGAFRAGREGLPHWALGLSWVPVRPCPAMPVDSWQPAGHAASNPASAGL